MRILIMVAAASLLAASAASAQTAESSVDDFLLSQLERRALSWDTLERPQLDLSIWATDNQICNLWYENHDATVHSSISLKTMDVAARSMFYPDIYAAIGFTDELARDMSERRKHLAVDDYCEMAALQTIIN